MTHPETHQSGPNENIGPRVDLAALYAAAQAEGAPNALASTERLRPGREEFHTIFLNASHGALLDSSEGLDTLLLPGGQPRENTLIGLNEITRDLRPRSEAELRDRGYDVIAPPDDSYLDLIWAVGPGIQSPEGDVRPFPRHGLRRFASRTSSKGYRHVGFQDVNLKTAGGNTVDASQLRLSPWVNEPVRRRQLRDMKAQLEAEMAEEAEQILPEVDAESPARLRIVGGDMNHIVYFRRPDDQLWNEMARHGWVPLVEPGTPTHTTAEKYPRAERLFRAIGREPDGQQLDAVYARAGAGQTLVGMPEDPGTQLGANEIGYATRVSFVPGTDHGAVETTFSLATPST